MIAHSHPRPCPELHGYYLSVSPASPGSATDITYLEYGYSSALRFRMRRLKFPGTVPDPSRDGSGLSEPSPRSRMYLPSRQSDSLGVHQRIVAIIAAPFEQVVAVECARLRKKEVSYLHDVVVLAVLGAPRLRLEREELRAPGRVAAHSELLPPTPDDTGCLHMSAILIDLPVLAGVCRLEEVLCAAGEGAYGAAQEVERQRREQ